MFAARKILAVALLFTAGVALSASDAEAQMVVRGPDGSLGFSNGMGGHTFIYPERLRPGANNAIPGTVQNIPNGQIWVGQDGVVHGNVLDPTTGSVHMRLHGGATAVPKQTFGAKNFSTQKQSLPKSSVYSGRRFRGQ